MPAEQGRECWLACDCRRAMNAAQCIYLIDSDEATQQLVCELADSMSVDCQVYATAEQFLEGYQPDRPGCVVSEFRLVGMSGLDLQNQLARAGRRIPIVFLSAYATVPIAVRAIRGQAIAVLEKAASDHELWDAVRQALLRDEELRKSETERVEIERRFKSLTQRERNVLQLLLEGKPNKSIAYELDLGLRTVETCRRNIFRKTQTSSVAGLVSLSLELERDANEK